MTTFGRRLAASRPDEIALRDEHRSLRWDDVDDALNRAANGLLALDLGPERRVAVFAENAVETLLANLGGLLAGASVVPINFHLSAEEAAYILRDSGAALLFVGPETAERGVAAAALSGVSTVVGWAEAPGVVPWCDWLEAQSAAEPPAEIPPLPNLLYTSGTTGRPKGTEAPPNVSPGGSSVAETVERLKEHPLAPHGTHLVVSPLYHAGPLGGARLLATGLRVVVLGRFDAEKTLAAIQEHRIGSTVMVPTHFVRLLALPEELRSRYDVGSLERVSQTGASCPLEVKRAMIDWWGPIFFEAYGATEVGITCRISSEEWLAHPGSVGRALAPFEALVLDDDGQPLPAGRPGRLYFRDHTGRGIVYHNDPEKTAAAHIAPGVFTLGEIGYVDEEGYVFITDRFSDMVVSGGVNLYPAEAEQVLMEHPDVADVACIGIPDAEMGEALLALAVPRNASAPPSQESVLAWCRQRLSGFKSPRRLDWVEDLGRNSMGKLDKRRLRAPYWEAGQG